jgi:hypothetical protein
MCIGHVLFIESDQCMHAINECARILRHRVYRLDCPAARMCASRCVKGEEGQGSLSWVFNGMNCDEMFWNRNVANRSILNFDSS